MGESIDNVLNFFGGIGMNKGKKFRVAIAYEEGFVIEIGAKSKEEAEKKAVEMTEEYAASLLIMAQ